MGWCLYPLRWSGGHIEYQELQGENKILLTPSVGCLINITLNLLLLCKDRNRSWVHSSQMKCFTSEGSEALNRFPRGVVDAPSLQTFKASLDQAGAT